MLPAQGQARRRSNFALTINDEEEHELDALSANPHRTSTSQINRYLSADGEHSSSEGGGLLGGASQLPKRKKSRRGLKCCCIAIVLPIVWMSIAGWMATSHPASSLTGAFRQKAASALAPVLEVTELLASTSKQKSSAAAGTTLTNETFVYATPVPELEPYSVHPIHLLMKNAKKEWEAKVARQSKTYYQARLEYERRYKRKPPPGFDEWYKFAIANKVQLVDEYDTIMDHILPFYSLPSDVLYKRIEALTRRKNNNAHAVLHIKNHTQVPWTGANWRPTITKDWDKSIKELLPYLPDMDVAIYLHDGPFTHMDASAIEGYRAAARAGEFVDEAALHTAGTGMWTARSRTCPLDSALRRDVMGLENQYRSQGPKFVANHLEEMDYCKNPANVRLHGSTSYFADLSALEPSFGMSRTSINADVLWPASIQYSLNPVPELAFRDKPQHRLIWRGSPDGIHVGDEFDWRGSHRFRLIFLTNSNDTTATRPVRVTKVDRFGNEYQVDVEATLEELNKRYTNVRPTQKPVQCDDGFCEFVAELLPFVPKATLEEMSEHRYVMDVDGNAYSARFRTHLMSNQVVFKSTRYPEWYSDRIEPWLHYVPIAQDYSDLFNTLAFFDGGLGSDREGNHDELAEEIAVASKDWAQKHWRDVDMQAYLFRLLLEWARVLDPARVKSPNE